VTILKRSLGFIAALVAMSLLLVSCGGGSSTPPVVKKDTVIERAIADVATFDPFGTADINAQRNQYQLFDGLIREEQDGSLVPALCASYKFNASGDEITFTLRPGVKFHNGDVMTAEDVVFSLNTAINAKITSRVTGVMKEAVKVDDKTVVLKLKNAFAPVIGCLANAWCSIVPKKVYEADPKAFSVSPVGTGPYMLKEVKKGEKIVFEAFPDYYRGPAPIKNLIVKIILDDSAALMAFENGELDIMQTSQAYTDRDAIMKNPKLKYYAAEQPAIFVIAFNLDRPLFKDKRVREAIARAVDRQDLILGACNGMANPVEAGIIPACPQYPADFKGLPMDLEKAKALLTEAGYPNGLDLTMRVVSADNVAKPAEILQAQLKKIGINLKVEKMERNTWTSVCLTGGDYDITFWGHAITVLDADFCTYPYLHSSEAGGKGSNYMNVRIPELNQYLEKARYSQDETERKQLYLKICEIIRDESLFVPCYSGKRTIAAVTDLKGIKADPMVRYYKYNYSW
jgi:peptide/nickel transport system substrate-binding protein